MLIKHKIRKIPILYFDISNIFNIFTPSNKTSTNYGNKDSKSHTPVQVWRCKKGSPYLFVIQGRNERAANSLRVHDRRRVVLSATRNRYRRNQANGNLTDKK